MKKLMEILQHPHLVFVVGGLLIIVFFIWLCTSPSLYSGFDYSSTGNIGDTIGGLSAPIIGIIVSYLVYTSFQAQLSANNMQFQALQLEIEKGNDEIKRYENDRIFQQHQLAIDDIKRAHKDLSFVVIWVSIDENGADQIIGSVAYSGLDALEQFILRMEKKSDNNNLAMRFANERYSAKSLFYNFLYMLLNTKELYERVENTVTIEADSIYFISNIINLYQLYIEPYSDRLKSLLPEQDSKKISDIDDDLKALLLL